jgi:hypothetical protein
MIIHQPLWAVVSATLLLLALGLFGRQALFVLSSEEATGEVSHIEAHDGRCGGKHKYDCTEFTATIDFTVSGRRHTTTTSAGSTRGHGASVQTASYREGQELPVLYAPDNPGHAYHNTMWDVWGTPIFAMFGQLATMLAAFSKPKQRKTTWMGWR